MPRRSEAQPRQLEFAFPRRGIVLEIRESNSLTELRMSTHTEPPKRRRHPGSGRGVSRRRPKGRQIDPAALDEVRALLGDRPRDRDLLIEHLHLIQDTWHCISAPHLAALAHEMRLPMAEVYEVATFYAHFDVLAEGEAPPPAITVRVCDSLSCELAGARALLELLPAALGENVRVVRAPCMGRCDTAPVAEVGHRHVDHVDEQAIRAVIEAGDLHPVIPEYRALDAYEQEGGYALLRACLAGEHTFEDITAKLDAAGLRGLGGAGFPTGRKWRIVSGYEGPRLMAVNADEGEPGTFKDRYYLETDPHRFLEGVLVAAWAVEAEAVYIYLRDEYPFIREILLREMAKLGPAGLDAHTTLHLRRGAGAYICGEETALFNSIEGYRGEPRNKPPFPTEVGLFGRPTLVNNVETLVNVPGIVLWGGRSFAAIGTPRSTGTKLFCLSGHVGRPGVYEVPFGASLASLLDLAGGVSGSGRLQGVLIGGAAGTFLSPRELDTPMTFEGTRAIGAGLGSAVVMPFDDSVDLRKILLRIAAFFRDESCGQCVPCRVGTVRQEEALSRLFGGHSQGVGQVPVQLAEIGQVMSDASICGLGHTASSAIQSALARWGEFSGPSQGSNPSG
jgi:formate dehydrogenase